MQPFSRHSGIAAPLLVDDMNTDQIAPFLPSRNLKDDYKVMLFNRHRFKEDGSEIADFVLNKPQFRNAGILVTGHNFGAGQVRHFVAPAPAPANPAFSLAYRILDESGRLLAMAKRAGALFHPTLVFKK